ncbi:MAG: DUF3332 domain-containing protein [Cyclobacteriaceae bacterium]
MKKALTLKSLAIVLLLSITLSSCIGSFTMSSKLKNWNERVTDSKFANEAIFFILLVIPVYSFTLFVDGLILNSIEFWTGDNPLSMKDGEVQKQNITMDGKNYELRASKNKMELFSMNNEKISEIQYDEISKTWTLNSNGQSQDLVTIESIDNNNINYKMHSFDCSQSELLVTNIEDLERNENIW